VSAVLSEKVIFSVWPRKAGPPKIERDWKKKTDFKKICLGT
jgi:hypothetical protein